MCMFKIAMSHMEKTTTAGTGMISSSTNSSCVRVSRAPSAVAGGIIILQHG